jgi:hypothetical protein
MGYLDHVLRLFKREKKSLEPKIIEYRGMKGFFTMEMIEEFERANIDYEKAFRESVDEVLEEAEDDRENQYQ